METLITTTENLETPIFYNVLDAIVYYNLQSDMAVGPFNQDGLESALMQPALCY